jgi:phage terminase large subunit
MIDLKISQPQMEFLNSDAISTGLVAGLGSGKSFIGTLKVLLFKLKYPNVKAAYYLPTFPLVRDIAFDKFPALCEMLNLEYTLNKSDKELHIKGYGKVIFRTMSEPESIIGYEVGYSLIDETDILPMEKMIIAYENITARNRQKIPDGSKNIVDVVGTPEGYKFFYTNFKKEPIEGSRLITASTYSNLHNLPEDYIDKLSALFPPNRLDAYLNGKFTNLTSGSVYSYFDRHKHHTDEVIKNNEQLYIGQDFNVGGCCSTVFVIRDNLPLLLEEFISHDTQQIIENIKDKYPRRVISIYPDASGNANKTNASKSDIALLREAGFIVEAPAKNGRVEDRINSVQLLLSQNKLRINTKNCPRTTEALEQQVYDNNGQPEKFGGAATIDDWNDSLGYFLTRRFGITASKSTVTYSKFI